MAMPSKTDINPATGKAYAVNPSSGVWDDNYWATQVEPALKSQYGSSSSGGGGTTIDPIAQAQKMLEFTRTANQPVIASLQATIPTTQQKYSTLSSGFDQAISSSQARYDQLIKDVTARSTQNVTEEFGKRNIPVSSGIYGQSVAKATEPQMAQLGIEREATLSGLQQQKALTGIEGIAAEQSINQAIAQLQAGDPASAVQSALAAIQAQQTANYQNRSLAIQEAEANKPTADSYVAIGNDYVLNKTTGQITPINQILGGGVSSGGPTKQSTEQVAAIPIASAPGGKKIYQDVKTGKTFIQ